MPLRNSVLEALHQVLELIDLVDDDYSRIPKTALSPIGKHVRHIVDHLWAFQEGMRTGCVDYNVRHRDTALETEPKFAENALHKFIAWFKAESLQRQDITVISEISASHLEQVRIPSSINRELAYLINHTLHHVAYASVLARSMGIAVPQYLGTAPATASYLRAQGKAPCAQ